MRPWQPFLALAHLTAVETIRQPILLLLLTACVVLTALMPMVQLHAFGEYGKLARESGLAFHFAFGLVAAVVAAGSSLARDVQTGTASVVLSKPVGRAAFFLSKFAGIALVVLAFSAGAMMATLLAERVAEQWTITPRVAGDMVDWRTGWWLLASPFLALAVAGLLNYTRHRPFESTAFLLILAALAAVLVTSGFFDRSGHRAAFGVRVDWRILPAGVLITAALATLAAIAASLASCFGTPVVLTVCAIVFVLGLLGEHLFGLPPDTPLAAWFYSLLPNWQHFWASDALTGGGRIPWSYVAHAVTYAFTYAGAVLALGVLSFQQVDLQAQP